MWAQNTCFNFRHIRLLGNGSKSGRWDLFYLQVLDYGDIGVEVSSSIFWMQLPLCHVAANLACGQDNSFVMHLVCLSYCLLISYRVHQRLTHIPLS